MREKTRLLSTAGTGYSYYDKEQEIDARQVGLQEVRPYRA